MDISILVSSLQSLPPIVISLLTFAIAYTCLSLFAFFFGKSGLYCYMVIALIMANIQVLKVSQFSFFSSPVALGTELFASTYLATDILAEVYGKKSAQKAVMIGFFALIVWTLFSILTLSFRPIPDDTMQNTLNTIFLPFPRFLIASMIAYLISQTFDVYIFSYLKNTHNSKYLWLRNNLSTILSSLIDNIVFSVIAFVILNPEPIKLPILIMTYILGTYLFRLFAALLDTPVVYLVSRSLKNKTKHII